MAKSEQEAASLWYQAEKAEYIYSDVDNCHSLAHSDSSSSQATPEKAATKRFREKPVVCYQEELNYLREKLMAWVGRRQRAGAAPQPRDGVVEDTFKLCDTDEDATVSSLEFLKYVNP